VTASFVEKVCKLPKDVGVPCGAGTNRTKVYYFDSFNERCMSFQYAGCKGNQNRFNTSDECVDSCQVAYLLKKNKNEPDPDFDIQKWRKKSDCSLSPERGPCKALITLWFYSPKDGACMVFGYGGCNGNYNRFDTENECKRFCMDKPVNKATPNVGRTVQGNNIQFIIVNLYFISHV